MFVFRNNLAIDIILKKRKASAFASTIPMTVLYFLAFAIALLVGYLMITKVMPVAYDMLGKFSECLDMGTGTLKCLVSKFSS